MKALIKTSALLLSLAASSAYAQRPDGQTHTPVRLQPEAAVSATTTIRTSGMPMYTVAAEDFRNNPALALSDAGCRLQSLLVSAQPDHGDYVQIGTWSNADATGRFVMRGEQYNGLLVPGTRIFLDNIAVRGADGQELPEQTAIIVLR